MTKPYRKWLDKDGISAARAKDAFRILVRQAEIGMPITYGDLARELGMNHHRPVRYAAGYVGFTLRALGQTKGWRKRAPPPLQALVVNQNTGMPGHGVDGFMTTEFRAAKTNRQRRAILDVAHAEIYAYRHWQELLDFLEIEQDDTNLEQAVAKATSTRGRGGEGKEHEALKLRIAADPTIVGLSASLADGKTEYGLPSGDRVDVVFVGVGIRHAVEVKSHISSEGDVARGLFQCFKYRAVLEAQSAIEGGEFDVEVLLALGGTFPSSLQSLKNALRIDVIDGLG